jgi:hypothetical protein
MSETLGSLGTGGKSNRTSFPSRSRCALSAWAEELAGAACVAEFEEPEGGAGVAEFEESELVSAAGTAGFVLPLSGFGEFWAKARPAKSITTMKRHMDAPRKCN